MLTVLFDDKAIQERVQQLAHAILSDYEGEPILLLVVLKGSFIFAADIARALGDCVEVDFVQVGSYGEGKSTSGVVQIRKDSDINCEGRNVLIVEDIVDSGLTLEHLKSLLATRNPKSLKVVTLLSKPDALLRNVVLDYVGFEVPNEFVVGYGLDFAEKYRSLPYVAILCED